MTSVVKDSFGVTGRVALQYGSAGVVVVFDLAEKQEGPSGDSRILVERPDGWMKFAKVAETKQHSATAMSCFLPGLERKDVPVGSKIAWGVDLQYTVVKDQHSTELTAAHG